MYCFNTSIESHLALLTMLLVGSQGHDHVKHVLKAVVGLGSGVAPLSTPSCGQRATASLSISAARGRGRHATASPSTSAARGRGRRTTTLRVVTSPEIPAPIPDASPQLEVLPLIPDASPQSEVPPPIVDASP
ncbi:hypothetical protein SO802_026502 [Lithocarpus litseifolius]|uniref:Uncharacterized protein n=1 Tax=Lithocarpus litseifolius TaxID=425828 RepID=A0AAW2C2E6_9ROSI